jgi:S1-C subfamily serine protease
MRLKAPLNLICVWLVGTAIAAPVFAVEVREQIQALKESAKSDPVAARKLGLLLIAGKRVPQDVTAGFGYLEQAAKLGDVESAKLLLKSYQNPKSRYYSPTKAAEVKKLLGYQPELSGTESFEGAGSPVSPVYPRQEKWPAESLPTTAPKAGGSGFAVNPDGVFISNFHVVEGCKGIVVSYNGMRANAKLVGMSEKDDLAALKVQGKTAIFLPVRKTPISLGEPVTVSGYPVGPNSSSMKLSEGIIARLINDRVFQMSASVSSGNSGGPVVDRTGSLVGISVGKHAAGEESGAVVGDDYNFAIRVERLHALLGDIREEYVSKPKLKSSIDAELMAKVLQQATANVLCYR